MPLQVHQSSVGGWLVIAISKDFSKVNSMEVQALIRRSSDEGYWMIALDLRGVTFLDTSGMGVLVGEQMRLMAHHGALRVVLGHSTQPEDALTATGLNRVLNLVYLPASAVLSAQDLGPPSPVPLSTAIRDSGQEQEASLHQQHEAFTRLLLEFYEWRHKIMTRFALVTGGFALTLRWLIEDGKPSTMKVGVACLAALVSAVLALLDHINQDVINICYDSGAVLEQKLGVDDVGMFTKLAERFKDPGNRKWLTYRFVLQLIYLLTSGGFLVVAATIAVRDG